jgi:hypothetical protein
MKFLQNIAGKLLGKGWFLGADFCYQGAIHFARPEPQKIQLGFRLTDRGKSADAPALGYGLGL